MGTVISMHHLRRIEGMVQRTKGKVVVGGKQMLGLNASGSFDFSKGSFLPPTVVEDIEIDDELWVEEVFGPVVVVKRFKVSTFLAHSF